MEDAILTYADPARQKFRVCFKSEARHNMKQKFDLEVLGGCLIFAVLLLIGWAIVGAGLAMGWALVMG